MTETKDLISLAGKLDWQMMHGSSDKVKPIIKQMRTKLTRLESHLLDITSKEESKK